MKKNSSKPNGVELSVKINNLLSATKDNNFLAIIPTTRLRFLKNLFCLIYSKNSGKYVVKTAYLCAIEPIKDFEIISIHMTPTDCITKYLALKEATPNGKP